MALMKRFDFVVLNAAGEPVVGCSVEARKQGATANASGSLTTIAVHHTGAIVATDSVDVDLGASGVSVSSVAGPSPMQVVLGSAKTVTNDVSRLTVLSPLPTIYNDADGTESKANPMTTDANGQAFCYAPFDYLDAAIAVTATGSAPNGPATPRLAVDQAGIGDGIATSPLVDSNGAVTCYIRDTIRTLVNASSKIESWRNLGSEKAFIDLNGKFSSSGGVVTTGSGVGTFAGLLTASNGFTLAGGTLTLPAGSVETADLAANAVHPAPSTITGSAADSADLPTSETVRLTTSYTPVSGNTGVRITVNIPYDLDATGSLSGAVEVRLYVGGALKAKAIAGSGTNNDNLHTLAFTWEEPTMAATPTTIEVRDIKVSYRGATSAVIKYFGASAYAGYMTIQELKK